MIEDQPIPVRLRLIAATLGEWAATGPMISEAGLVIVPDMLTDLASQLDHITHQLDGGQMNDDDQGNQRIGEQVANTLRNAEAIVDKVFPSVLGKEPTLEYTLKRTVAFMYTIDALDDWRDN